MDLLKRLDIRRWVSMSLERAWALAPTIYPRFLQSTSTLSANFEEELTLGSESFRFALEYIYGPEESLEEQSRNCATVFQAGTPGTMSVEEVQDQIDLDRWGVRLGNTRLRLQVNAASLS